MQAGNLGILSCTSNKQLDSLPAEGTGICQACEVHFAVVASAQPRSVRLHMAAGDAVTAVATALC